MYIYCERWNLNVESQAFEHPLLSFDYSFWGILESKTITYSFRISFIKLALVIMSKKIFTLRIKHISRWRRRFHVCIYKVAYTKQKCLFVFSTSSTWRDLNEMKNTIRHCLQSSIYLILQWPQNNSYSENNKIKYVTLNS